MKYLIFVLLSSFALVAAAQNYTPERGALNPERVNLVTGDTPYLELKPGLTAIETVTSEAPDVVFPIEVPEAGQYTIQSVTAVAPEGRETFLNAKNKFGGLNARMAIDDGVVTMRVLVKPPCRDFDRTTTHLGIFTIPEKSARISLWLPPCARLLSLKVQRYNPPKVPENAEKFVPPYSLPEAHPRLWVTRENLPALRERLTRGENASVWESVQAEVRKPFAVQVPENRMAADHSPHLLRQIRLRAFVAMVENDPELGRAAADLMISHLRRVEFGNVMDITREIGETMYHAALVYDWTFDWLTEDERTYLAGRMMELAAHLECSYPPFKSPITLGHGNESMILRDTLSVGIAIHEIHPEVYKYCMSLICEQLVPVRAYQYQSPRHNQGASYGFYRPQWELYAALMIRAAAGSQPFDLNIRGLGTYLLHMRTPSGVLFPDGDGYSTFPMSSAANVAFLISALTADPMMKGEALRYGGLTRRYLDPVEFLILNDPELAPEFSYKNLPLALDTGTVLPSHLLRTEWMDENWMRFDLPERNFAHGDPDSDAVLVEYKGGGRQSANHHHLDAGAFQIYYRGWQAVDLGIYFFYGTPNDWGFNKSSGSHNVLFIDDPAEPVPPYAFRDGGQRFMPRNPYSYEDCVTNPEFQVGKVLESKFEPSAENPRTATLKCDLTNAYTDKVESYLRTFRWYRTGRSDVPVVLVVDDVVTVRDPSFRKSWQINTLNAPELNSTGFVSTAPLPKDSTLAAPGRLALTVLLPTSENREIRTRNVSELPAEIQPEYTSRRAGHPFLAGFQTRVFAKNPAKTERFLNVLQVLAPGAQPLPVELRGEEIWLGEERL